MRMKAMDTRLRARRRPFGGWSRSFGARPRSGRLRIAEQISRRNRCQRSRTAHVIDDVFNRADIADPESDREKIAELDSGSIRRFHPAGCNDGWIRSKVAVHPHPKALEISNPILYFEGCESVNPLMRKVCLGRRVIRHFALIEVIYPIFAVPDRLIILEMLDSQSVRNDIVAVNNDAVFRGVYCPADGVRISMIRAPYPDIVDDHVARIDFETHRCFPDIRSADPEKDILNHRRIVRVRPRVTQETELRLISDADKNLGVLDSGIEQNPDYNPAPAAAADR